MKLINGRALAEVIKDKIAAEIRALNGSRPGLAIILVGERPDSALYVNLKEKQAKSVGIDTHLYRCDDDITQEQVLAMIDFLNADPEVTSILIQLPLPGHLDTDIIVNHIAPEKDVDGFTKINLDRLMADKAADPAIIPPVYGVIFTMLQSIDLSLRGKQMVIIANSDIFENNLAEILRRQDAKVILADVDDPNLNQITAQADILITAVGRAEYIKAKMIKPDTVIIDIGISTTPEGTVVGDVALAEMKDLPGYVTPVPGGVGPMTIAMAFWNTLEMFKKNKRL